MRYKIYRVGKTKTLVSSHPKKLEAVLALKKICDELGGDYYMFTPVECWKANSKYGVFSPTKHTYYCINDF